MPTNSAIPLFVDILNAMSIERHSRARQIELGRILAEKVNLSTGPVTVLLPRRAISIISAAGQPFHDPAADAALFTAIRAHLRNDIPIVELDAAINDPAFASACANTLLAQLQSAQRR